MMPTHCFVMASPTPTFTNWITKRAKVQVVCEVEVRIILFLNKRIIFRVRRV